MIKNDLETVPTIRQKSLKSFNYKHWLTRLHHLILGKEADQGLIFKLVVYLILFGVAYIYLRPLIYMAVTMVKDSRDLLDPTVIWVPMRLYWGNLQTAWEALTYPSALLKSMYISSIGAIAQVVACSIAGYGFARLQFPLKKFWFVCLLLAFIIPPQLLALPDYLLFNEFKLIDTIWPFLVPAFFGHGLRGALFVIIFRQFFSTQPVALEEAARIDGAGVFRIFFRVMLPLAIPAVVVVFLFSFVWHWNDTFLQALYMGNANQIMPLSIGVNFIGTYLAMIRESGVGESALFSSLMEEPINMAACFLTFIPLIILYVYAQKWFIEGIERTGIVE